MTILVELGRKGSSFPLFVPLIHPGDRTDGLEVLEEKLAGTIFLSLQVLTTVEVDIVLPAVSRLVLIWEYNRDADLGTQFHRSDHLRTRHICNAAVYCELMAALLNIHSMI